MARVTIYLPDDVHEQVKATDLNVSAVCRAAIVRRLKRDSDAAAFRDANGRLAASRRFRTPS